tara:strand:+ start:381 stop:602 length:222 start_codon:yes stop_codon:yes gene_type:complete
MSKEIKTKAKELKLTQFSGGKNGLMLHILQDNYFKDDFTKTSSDIFLAKHYSSINLTKKQALQLGKDLIKWSK